MLYIGDQKLPGYIAGAVLIVMSMFAAFSLLNDEQRIATRSGGFAPQPVLYLQQLWLHFQRTQSLVAGVSV